MRRAVVVLVASCALLSGCELIADFDRSKIVTDAGTEPPSDASIMEDATIIPPPPVDEDAGDEDAGF